MRKNTMQVISVLIVLIFTASCAGRENSSHVFPPFDENANLSWDDNLLIRSVLDDLLFDNFPVNGVGTGAGNRISIWLRLADEEAVEVIDEMMTFIAETIASHPTLSTMDINLGVFEIETSGPIRRHPVESHEFGPISFPPMPQPRNSPISKEEAYDFFDAFWGHWGQPQHVGDEIVVGGQAIAAHVFRLNDMRNALSAENSTRFHYAPQLGGWRVVPNGILYHDETKTLPIMHITDVSAAGLSYFFTNQTKTEFLYGTPFALYVREGDKWRLLSLTGIFTMQGIPIHPLTTTETRSLNWERYFEDGLPPGEYKFTKGFSYSHNTDGFVEFTASQRFIID